MARAAFEKGQRVFVRAVGVWAKVERVIPHWVKGVEEPLKVLYDVGLGREFATHELVSEQQRHARSFADDIEDWRVLRLRSHWEFDGAAPGDRRGGTYPVMVTDALDWGGWRVPKAEYDRDPDRIEYQARILANGLRLFRIARELVAFGEEHDNLPPALQELVARADDVLRAVHHDPEMAITLDAAAE